MVMARPDPKPFPNLPPKPLPQPLPGPVGPEAPHCPPPPPKPGSFEAKDANHDGKLNADEFNEGRGLIDKLKDPDKFDRYDADNDGYVTAKENFSGQLHDAFGTINKKSGLDLPGIKAKAKEIGEKVQEAAKSPAEDK